MNVITEIECRAVIVAKSPLGSPLDASIEPSNTPNTPETEFPARNRDAHESSAFTVHWRRREYSFLPRLRDCQRGFLLRKAPDADGVNATPEWPSNVSHFGESGVFCHYVAHLIHSSSPAESVIQMIENLHSVCCSFVFQEV